MQRTFPSGYNLDIIWITPTVQTEKEITFYLVFRGCIHEKQIVERAIHDCVITPMLPCLKQLFTVRKNNSEVLINRLNNVLFFLFLSPNKGMKKTIMFEINSLVLYQA